jgi:peptidoglycan/xylan/chitin deacetylase (PgdA/CDA1 family)
MFGSARQPINRVIATPMKAYHLFASEFDGLYAEGRLFNLTMHPQLTGRSSRTRMLEKLIRHIRARPGVWFAKCSDVAEYWLKTAKKESK